MRIPFYDYSIINRKLKKEILKEINLVLNLADNSSHESYVRGLENKAADYFNTKFAIGVDSGTTALQLAMVASGIGEGDEVILPSYTYISTALSVSNIGAKPVFIDIKEEDLTINPTSIENTISKKTKAIIPVHIHGNPCDIGPILEICKKYNLELIEDASQAHGAEYKGKKIGSFGIGCFSLHTSKTLGGVGNAGIITLNDRGVYDKIKKMMVPGNNTKELLLSKRTPCIMDAIQAAIIKVKLSCLDGLNKKKNKIAELYNSLIANEKIKKIVPRKDSCPVYRDYCIRVDNREGLRRFLGRVGIETKARYKLPVHLTETFTYLGYKRGDFPVTEKISREVLCLPSFVGLTDDKIEFVCEKINKF